MTADLLPCPFCGGSAEQIDFGPGSGDNEGGSCIACTKCQSSGPVEFGYKENFVSNWNRRALSHASGQEAEYPECTGDPKDCPENEGHGCCKTATINTAEIDRKLVGGEAVAPFAWGYLFPHDGETDHCLSMARFLPSWVEAKGATEHPLYLTPAQPPASAEVGGANCKRFEVYERVVWTSKFGTKFSGAVRHINAPEPLSYFVDLDDGTSVQRAMPSDLASSGRKESPIAGVTHGTDEGWGDLGPQGTHTQRQG